MRYRFWIICVALLLVSCAKKSSMDGKHYESRGVEQAAALWTEEDGSQEEFEAFVEAHLCKTDSERVALFESLSRILEKNYESADLLTVELLKPTQLTNAGEPQTPDAITNYKLTQELGIPASAPAEATRGGASAGVVCSRTPDVVVDAIYGTGFHGRLRENGAAASGAIARAKATGAKVFALDIPSGMGGDLTDESELDERCVRADVTITFHAKKQVHLQPFAQEYCGKIIVADIGIVDDDQEAAEAAQNAEAVQNAATAQTPAGVPSQTKEALADKGVYTFRDFVDIVAQLRAPDGCVWDRAQTHETLTKYMTEEAQEAVDAMRKGDNENLCEELGDVLLQVVLNAQLGAEDGAFTIDDVIQGISEKMIRRHPWVFGDVDVNSIDENVSLWEEIKKREKASKSK